MSPDDPGGLTKTGTGFDSGTGLFTAVGGAHTSGAVQGYRHALARWETPLEDLIPDFSPLEQVLEYALDFRTPGDFPLFGGVNDAFGIFVGIVDRAGDLSNTNGHCVGVHIAGAALYSVYQMLSVTGTAVSMGAGAVPSVTYGSAQYGLSTSYRAMQHGYTQSVAGPITMHTLGSQHTTLTFPGAWQLITGCYHLNTTSPEDHTVDWRVFWRALPRGDAAPT